VDDHILRQRSSGLATTETANDLLARLDLVFLRALTSDNCLVAVWEQRECRNRDVSRSIAAGTAS
jgi:hypothetical protein